MTFRSLLVSLNRRWVILWTVEGDELTGRMLVHEDCVEVMVPEGPSYYVRLSSVSTVRRDPDEEDRILRAAESQFV